MAWETAWLASFARFTSFFFTSNTTIRTSWQLLFCYGVIRLWWKWTVFFAVSTTTSDTTADHTAFFSVLTVSSLASCTPRKWSFFMLERLERTCCGKQYSILVLKILRFVWFCFHAKYRRSNFEDFLKFCRWEEVFRASISAQANTEADQELCCSMLVHPKILMSLEQATSIALLSEGSSAAEAGLERACCLVPTDTFEAEYCWA